MPPVMFVGLRGSPLLPDKAFSPVCPNGYSFLQKTTAKKTTAAKSSFSLSVPTAREALLLLRGV